MVVININIDCEDCNTIIHTQYGTAKLYNNGYYKITSHKEGNNGKLLHRLIWERHNGTIPKGYVIHHIDGDKTNNHISNLELMKWNEHNKQHSKGSNNAMYGKRGENSPNYGKKHTEKTKKKMSKSKSGENNPRWKTYARIIKRGTTKSGKQNYSLIFNGKRIKQSIFPDKLLNWFITNYPLEIIKVGVVDGKRQAYMEVLDYLRRNGGLQ